MCRRDLIQISILSWLYITLTLYKEPAFGLRNLRTGCYALDLTYVSIIVKKYWFDTFWK